MCLHDFFYDCKQNTQKARQKCVPHFVGSARPVYPIEALPRQNPVACVDISSNPHHIKSIFAKNFDVSIAVYLDIKVLINMHGHNWSVGRSKPSRAKNIAYVSHGNATLGAWENCGISTNFPSLED